MRRKVSKLLIMAFLLSLMFGCGHFDKKAFENAKLKNTVSGYMDYLIAYPNGKYVKEAEASICKQIISKYQEFAKKADKAEKSKNWSKALELWTNASEIINYGDYSSNSEIKTYQNEAKSRLERCKAIIENPVSFSDVRVIGRGRQNILSRVEHYSLIEVEGKIKNNLTIPISEIVIHFELVVNKNNSVFVDPFDNSNRVEYDTIVSIDKAISPDEILSADGSREFAFDVIVDVEIYDTIFSNNPKFKIKVKSFQTL